MRADHDVVKTAVAAIAAVSALTAAEQTPLLEESREAPNGNAAAGHVGDVAPDSDEPDAADKPLPVWQIAALCYARWVEPVAFFSIFPYSESLDPWQASRLQLTSAFSQSNGPRERQFARHGRRFLQRPD